MAEESPATSSGRAAVVASSRGGGVASWRLWGPVSRPECCCCAPSEEPPGPCSPLSWSPFPWRSPLGHLPAGVPSSGRQSWRRISRVRRVSRAGGVSALSTLELDEIPDRRSLAGGSVSSSTAWRARGRPTVRVGGSGFRAWETKPIGLAASRPGPACWPASAREGGALHRLQWVARCLPGGFDDRAATGRKPPIAESPPSSYRSLARAEPRRRCGGTRCSSRCRSARRRRLRAVGVTTRPTG